MASPYFTLKELTRSEAAVRLGLDNIPPAREERALWALVGCVLDPLRAKLGRPLRVNSAYRGPEANKAVGGSASSQHMKGQAADIEVDGMANKALAQFILDRGLPFDQLILEFYNDSDPNAGWVHVSYCDDGSNRREVITAYRDKTGKTKYVAGLGVPKT